VSAIDNPSACFCSRIFLFLFNFLSARFDVRLIVTSAKKQADVLGVIAFVEADMLMSQFGLEPMNRRTVEVGFEKFNVVSVGASDRHSQRNAASVSEY
jgi:hypothetical protein